MFVATTIGDVLPATLLLLAFAIVGSVVILRLRKSAKTPPGQTIPFSLHSLKKLRDEGTITHEEYGKAKQAVIDGANSGSSDIHDENE